MRLPLLTTVASGPSWLPLFKALAIFLVVDIGNSMHGVDHLNFAEPDTGGLGLLNDAVEKPLVILQSLVLKQARLECS